jgi:hypothetical protein
MSKRLAFLKYGAVFWRIHLCMRIYFYHIILGCVIACLSWTSLCAKEKDGAEGAWIKLFNGKNLRGWTPKFSGYDLGVNFKNTFLVRDGLLTVCYDKYKHDQNNIGHLFYRNTFSHYILRVEYRFVGAQVTGAAGSKLPVSGLMLHGQSADSMGKMQQRPASFEAKLLGANRGHHVEPSRANEDSLAGATEVNKIQGDQWTSVEIEVYGGEVIRQRTGGHLVTEYKKPCLSDGSPLARGTIALQASGYPIQFRKIELKVLNQ